LTVGRRSRRVPFQVTGSAPSAASPESWYEEAMKQVFQSRGKGDMEILREARRLLGLAISADPHTGKNTLTRDAIYNLIDQGNDESHFREPMVLALLDLILAHEAVVVFPAQAGDGNSGSA
jgi:hypothetical protein